MPHARRKYPLIILSTAVAVLSFILLTLGPVCADAPLKKQKSNFSIWSPPLKFFQKYISRADGDRCPMYPSCSHYAKQAFERHGALKGWILTSDRLLRCGHDEIRLAPKVNVKGKPRAYDPIEANTRWWGKP